MKSCLILFLTSFVFLIAEEAQWLRTPALSPDGSKILFGYQGDLFQVDAAGGMAIRLTSGPDYEGTPRFSHDGQWIAFLSDRDGGDHLYTMKADGTSVRRHTFFASGNRLFDFYPDNQGFYFGSRRGDRHHWMPEVYGTTLTQETPEKKFTVNAIDLRLDTHSGHLFFVNGFDHRWRRHYRGSANNDIFSLDPSTLATRQWTTFAGNDLCPMPAPEGLYFLSDRFGAFELFLKTTPEADAQRIELPLQESIRFAAISDRGRTIILAAGLQTLIYDLNTKTLKPLSIQVPEDGRADQMLYKTYKENANQFSVAPGEKEFVVSVHGELYATNLGDKEHQLTQRLTEHPFNDTEPVFGAKGETLYFLSDRDHQTDVYALTPETPGPFFLNRKFQVTRLTQSTQDESKLQMGPLGTHLFFVRGKGQLIRMNLESRQEEILVDGWDLTDFSISPDGAWVAFSKADHNFNTDVFLKEIQSQSEPVNLSRHPDDDFGPVWSPDGKWLSFASRRFGNQYEVLLVPLLAENYYKNAEDYFIEKSWKALTEEQKKGQQEDEKEEKGKQKKKAKAKADEEKKPKPDPVKIDLEDIYKRLMRFTKSLENASPVAFTPKSDALIYQVQTSADQGPRFDLVHKTLVERKDTALTNNSPSPRQWQLGEKALYFLHKNGTMRSVDFKGKDEQNHAFSAPFSTDLLQEQRCVFEDIWRYQKEYFYDGAFHGADWDQLRSVYAQWVSAIRHERDFNDLMNMLVGELNASHQRYAGKRKAETVYGHLGIQVTTQENRWTITDILPKSPFARAFPTVPVGAQLVAVEGLRSGNLFQALRDRVGERISVTVNDGTKEHTAILRPVSQRELADQLAYPAWVEANRKRVHDQTDHRLGYLHIEGMDIPSLEVFEMELFSEAADKEALVIDVRYNGGGWTTDFLLNMLFTPDHAYTIPRDGHEGYPQGRRTFFHWHQPVYVLCNEFSYSNAEIFSHAIKTLKRGTLIGTPTFGAVISTGGKSLINGAWIRMPFRGWYVKGSGINQENNGAVPHEIVPYTPDDQLKGTDPQLDKAIELFLKNPSK